MRTLGNIIWFVFGGFIGVFLHLLAGILLSITIIGIPFGIQCFKIAGLYMAPFGKEVRLAFEKYPIANILWIIFFGWEMLIAAFVIGLLCMITIIGIPFGKQWFKLGVLAFAPFGAEIVLVKL